MDSRDLVRDDFPPAGGGDGFDRATVIAHQQAVAAHVAALEARIQALEVERDVLAASPPAPAPEAKLAEPTATEPEPETAPETAVGTRVEAGPDEVAARLRISSMALDGADRDEIRTALAGEFETENLDSLLDDVLDRLG